MENQPYTKQVDEDPVGSLEIAENGSEPTTPAEKHKDAQTYAVVMMNIYCVANTTQCILYKFMSEKGTIDLLEYTFFRNVTIMVLCIALLKLQSRDPVALGYAMTHRERQILLIRAILGFVITLIVNLCLTMIPFSLLVILL